MQSATTWLGIAGGVLMVVAMGRNYKGALMIGILFVTFISWIPGHQVGCQAVGGGEANGFYAYAC